MTILQALDRYYDRLEARGAVVSPGWSEEPIGQFPLLFLRSDRKRESPGLFPVCLNSPIAWKTAVTL